MSSSTKDFPPDSCLATLLFICCWYWSEQVGFLAFSLCYSMAATGPERMFTSKAGEGAVPGLSVLFVRRVKAFPEAFTTFVLLSCLQNCVWEAKKASSLYNRSGQRRRGWQWLKVSWPVSQPQIFLTDTDPNPTPPPAHPFLKINSAVSRENLKIFCFYL